MKAFWVQMIDLDLFFDISRDVAIATIKVEKLAFFTDQSTLLRCHSERDCNIAIAISKD